MLENDLALEELEELSYYDFMGYMDVPFFNIGGVGSIDRLAELCEIRENSKVLVVGCGTGATPFTPPKPTAATSLALTSPNT